MIGVRICPLRAASAALTALVFLVAAAEPNASAHGADFVVRRQVIDADFPGAYQVEVADVDGDKKPDIIAVGGGTCAWYQNPTWKKRIVSGPDRTPRIISSATADLDGDGRAEIAIAYDFEMNEPLRGKLLLATRGAAGGIDGPWQLRPITEVGSIHRLRWGDVDGDGKDDLVVAPIFGPEAKPPRYDEDAAQVSIVRLKEKGGTWEWSLKKSEPLFPVLHAIALGERNVLGYSPVYTASNIGVNVLDLGPLPRGFNDTSLTSGHLGHPPKRGASEIHVGRLKDGRGFLATIEPWHGYEVAVYVDEKGKAPLHGPRDVIDDSLDDGHALWVADVDGDGDDEVLAGHRGKDHRVSLYDRDRATGQWARTVIDRDIAAQDLRGGDLDGDRSPDVVAVGGSTHNVVWYCFRRP
jgi:hypothetical protein